MEVTEKSDRFGWLLVCLLPFIICSACHNRGPDTSGIDSVNSRSDAEWVVEELSDEVIRKGVVNALPDGNLTSYFLPRNNGSATVTGYKDPNSANLDISFNNFTVTTAENITETIKSGSVRYVSDSTPWVTIRTLSPIQIEILGGDGSWGYRDTITFYAEGSAASRLTGTCTNSWGIVFSF